MSDNEAGFAAIYFGSIVFAFGFWYGRRVIIQRRLKRLERRTAAIAEALAWGMSRNTDAPPELIARLRDPADSPLDGG